MREGAQVTRKKLIAIVQFSFLATVLFASVILMKVNLPLGQLLNSFVSSIDYAGLFPLALIFVVVVSHGAQEAVTTRIREGQVAGRIPIRIEYYEDNKKLTGEIGATDFFLVASGVAALVTLFLARIYFSTWPWSSMNSGEWFGVLFLGFVPYLYQTTILANARTKGMKADCVPPTYAIRPFFYVLFANAILWLIYPLFASKCGSMIELCHLRIGSLDWVLRWDILGPKHGTFWLGTVIATTAFILIMKPLWKIHFGLKPKSMTR